MFFQIRKFNDCLSYRFYIRLLEQLGCFYSMQHLNSTVTVRTSLWFITCRRFAKLKNNAMLDASAFQKYCLTMLLHPKHMIHVYQRNPIPFNQATRLTYLSTQPITQSTTTSQSFWYKNQSITIVLLTQIPSPEIGFRIQVIHTAVDVHLIAVDHCRMVVSGWRLKCADAGTADQRPRLSTWKTNEFN